jgi:hypothetical protein
MQKIVNVVALSSGIVSLAVICSGVYVYVNKDSIVDGVKQQVMDAVTGSLGDLGGLAGGGLGSGLGGGALIPEGDAGIAGGGIAGGAVGGAGIVAPPVIPSF